MHRSIHRSPDRRGAALRPAGRSEPGTRERKDLAEVRQAGYGGAEFAEIVGRVALNVLTNHFNTVAQIVVDFPKTGKLVPARS